MKTKYILFIFIVSGAMACSDSFTDLAPISQRNAGNFYNTAADMEVAVNAIYNTLKTDGCYNQSYWVLQELRSDNTFWDGTGLAEEITVFDKFTDIPTSDITEAAWNDSYLGISRANIVLGRIEAIDIDAALKSQLVGEALFLRSLFYYHLAVGFGNIPLILTETSSVSEGLEHTQSNADAVLSQVATDLSSAASMLPVSYSGSDVGRATQGAANTLLGKVYLTLGDNANAATALRQVTSGGYSLVPDVADLWGLENENNAESIFEVQFEGGLGDQGNTFTNQFHGVLSVAVTSGQRNIPEADLIAEYEDGDARLGLIDGLSEINPYTIKYGSTNSFTDDDAANNWVVFRYADALLMLAEAVGESPEGYDLINQVRARAGLAPIDSSTPGSYAENLLHERRVEFAFENHRWADLLRFGVAESVLAAQGKSVNGRLLFAIPQRELDLNSNFIQNPGY